MKIAISATGSTLDAEVEPRFGRCQYFIIADPETMEFEAVDNSSAMAAGGAGISAAQAIAVKGVQAVLTGNCGPNAYQVLSSAGIQIITGVSGSVKDAVDGYRSGKFQASAQANVPDHFGMGGDMGRGRSANFNQTMPTNQVTQPSYPEQELQTLKAQSKEMAHQLAEMQRRIEELAKQ